MRLALGLVLVLALALAPAGAWAKNKSKGAEDTADSAEAIAIGRTGESPYQVPRSDGEMKIDGRLDEPVWAAALRVSLDYETRPGENIPPPVATSAFFTHSDSHLYIAFEALDPDPKQIRAHLSDRDDAFSDDFVGVVLDPFNDERRGWEFFVNPLGVQMDLFQDDVNGNEDESWDAIWDSAGRITEEGYVVEMAIPFHQLRFPASNGEKQVWGFDALRFYPRNQRHRIASQPLDRGIDCYLCQSSKMEGFDNVTAGRNVELIPTLTGTRVDERLDFPEGELTEGDLDPEVGFTAKWGITPNLILNGTINPDFSQVEADVAQLNVNNQFALFFPETRPFFLEGADFFDTPFNAVFTRNVADPDWGLKVTGKRNNNAVGVFSAQDAITNLIFPGSQGSDSESFDLETVDSVLRYRRDVGQNSAVGAMVTGRQGGDYSNIVGGIDGLYRITDADSVSFQFLSSQTEYPLDIVEDFEQPSGSFRDEAYTVRYSRSTREWDVYGRYTDVGANFRADMGFMPRVDYTFLLGGAERTFWGEEDDWYTRWSVGADWDLTEDQSGQLLEREFETWFEIGGPKQSFLWFDVGQRDQFFDGVTFDDQQFVQGWFEIEPTGKLFFGIYARVSEEIDFANTQPGDSVRIEPQFRLNIGKNLRFRLSHDYQAFDVDGGRLFTANLTQSRLIYQFNVRTFVRLITQWTDVERDPSLYIDEVEARTERLFNQLLFSYKLNPQTVLFVGYSDTRRAETDFDLTQDDRSLFIKIGYAWVL